MSNILVISTDSGLIHRYDIDKEIFAKPILLPKISDFMGDRVYPRIFSVDKMGKILLALSESGKGGYSNLWLVKNHKLRQILFAKDKLLAIKARFVDEGHILLGLLSNEAVLFDVKKAKVLSRLQLSPSKFSDFALNEDKSQAVFACESGVLSVIHTHKLALLESIKSLHVDNVYSVDFKAGIISASGQDRRASVYDTKTKESFVIKAPFLVYATALSPLAKFVAFAMDEENSISIYERGSQVKIAELKGQKSTLNRLIFKDEKSIFSSSNDSTIMLWKCK
jgi:WD40 repeat protein